MGMGAHAIEARLAASIGKGDEPVAPDFQSVLDVPKGGVLFAISDSLKLPIRFIGVGEAIDDLKPFNAKDFVDALFD